MLLKKTLEETLGNKMTNKEFQRMISLFTELDNLLKKYERHITHEEYAEEAKPIMIPDDVYDEICFRLDIERIDLLGVS